jgi:hypothetical protein
LFPRLSVSQFRPVYWNRWNQPGINETKVMRKEVQETPESAIVGFEKRQQAEQERLRERERFETDWARIRTAVVLESA